MSNVFTGVVLGLGFVAASLAAVVGEPKKPHEDLPTDRARYHVERITESRHAYNITFRGTVDGVMTRGPIGYVAFEQGWEPNRSVLIENIGETDVVNPWLTVNGRRNWRTLEDIVAEATRGYTQPADRARAIWEFIRRRRFHACTWDAECNDAVKVLNVYGYTLCGNQALVLNDLWAAAGLKTRRCFPVGHVVGEVFFDGAWHMFDSDEHVICLRRDNRTIASAAEIVRDHDLMKRTHTYGIGQAYSRRRDEFSASLYSYEGSRGKAFPRTTKHSMDLTLRPGESLELRWDHVGKQYTAGKPLHAGQRKRDGWGDLLQGWGPIAYDKLRNGKLRYRPDLCHPIAAWGADAIENAVFDTGLGVIRPIQPEKPARVQWRFHSPYVFVGGSATAQIALADQATAQWQWSPDGKQWRTVVEACGPGDHSLAAELDDLISPRGKPMYRFWLRLVLNGDGAAGAIDFEHDIQASALGLPELTVGTNRIVYTDQTRGPRRVRVTHRWMERTEWHPPTAPERSLFPADGQTVDGTRFTFRWSEATDPDGDRIVDYHFELSEYPDMRWPLSPNFEWLTSRTTAQGRPEWTIPYAGLLNPGTTYYWHVRARDETGVWGPWSRPFRFRVRAPSVPLDVKLLPDDGGWVLNWKPNPEGTQPVAYKVYGSDEKGFTVSDKPYKLFRGKGFVSSMEEFEAKPANAPDAGVVEVPGNLIARVTDTRLRVIGPHLSLPNTNKAYYRVVAVDKRGVESGPSDYAEAPRPYVYTTPPTTARVGQPYRYQPGVIRSIGDLRCHRSEKSSYNAAYWDRDRLTFSPISLPEGLRLDPSTGELSGMLPKPGQFDVAFRVSNQSGQATTVRYRLKVIP